MSTLQVDQAAVLVPAYSPLHWWPVGLNTPTPTPTRLPQVPLLSQSVIISSGFSDVAEVGLSSALFFIWIWILLLTLWNGRCMAWPQGVLEFSFVKPKRFQRLMSAICRFHKFGELLPTSQMW